jgi:hypothetical protein
LVVYDGASGRGLRPIDTYTAFGVGTSASNVKLATTGTLSADKTINALLLAAGNGNIVSGGSGTHTLTIVSGALVGGGPIGTQAAPVDLNFGTQEGIINGGFDIFGSVHGTGGLTVQGGESVLLWGNNTYTGTTILGSSKVSIKSVGAFGESTNAIVVMPGSNAAPTPDFGPAAPGGGAGPDTSPLGVPDANAREHPSLRGTAGDSAFTRAQTRITNASVGSVTINRPIEIKGHVAPTS